MGVDHVACTTHRISSINSSRLARCNTAASQHFNDHVADKAHAGYRTLLDLWHCFEATGFILKQTHPTVPRYLTHALSNDQSLSFASIGRSIHRGGFKRSMNRLCPKFLRAHQSDYRPLPHLDLQCGNENQKSSQLKRYSAKAF